MQSGKGIICLSLFDGISCGRIALERAGIKVDNYYASEIDKNAISITQKNFSNTIQLGDVRNWKNWHIDFSEIDLLLAGFPCQSWSVAGLQKGTLDERGQLLFDLIDIWKHINNEKEKCNKEPVKFLFENVRMKSEFMLYISNLFQVDPIEINSSLVSAQNRERLYWTNIYNIQQPIDKQIMLKDILLENTNPEIDISSFKVPFDKSLKILEKEIDRRKIGYFNTDSQANRVYSIHGKSVTLCGDAGGGSAKMGQYLFGCITPDRINKRQNGQRFSKGDKFYTLTAQDSHGVLLDGYIRKLSPLECERLQTLKDVREYIKLDFKEEEVEWFLEHQNTNAQSVAEKCHKWQKPVGNVEKIGLNEFAQYVVRNMNLKNPQIKKPVVWNVHINYEELIKAKNSIEKSLKNVNNVEKIFKHLHQKPIGDFVLPNVGTLITSEKTMQVGEVESHLREKLASSELWKRRVKQVWERDNATCQRCGRRYNHNGKTFEIHHIIPFARRKYRTKLSNLVLLCPKCHNWVHSNKNTNKDFIDYK